MTFKAILVSRADAGLKTDLVTLSDADLGEGDVTVAVEYSTINYKDGLAISGRGNIIQTFPLIPGIDLAGTVETSTSADFKPGDRVVIHAGRLARHIMAAFRRRRACRPAGSHACPPASAHGRQPPSALPVSRPCSA